MYRAIAVFKRAKVSFHSLFSPSFFFLLNHLLFDVLQGCLNLSELRRKVIMTLLRSLGKGSRSGQLQSLHFFFDLFPLTSLFIRKMCYE